MPNTYAEIPYGSSSAGIALNYGDTVPEGAVNLAYVQTAVPPVSDVVDIEDDLSDADKYAGNTIGAGVQTLTIVDGLLIDPKTNNLWVAPTDNVLFTTVSAKLTDATGAVISIPLFYAQELRFPIPLTALPASLQDILANGIPTGADSYLDASLSSLTNLVTITSDSGNLVPTGFLWTVLPTSIDAGELYMTLYTNFASSFQQRFVMSWGPFSETLNVHPIYFQHRTTPGRKIYLAKPIQDNSIGSIEETANIVSGSSTAQIIAGGGLGTSNQPRSSPVANVANPSIVATSSSTPASSAIALTTESPSYVSGPTGYTVFPAPPVTYATPSLVSAPVDLARQLSLTLTNVSCQSDTNGQGLVFVTLYDPTGIPVKSWPAITAPTAFTYFDPNARSGSYSWTITGSVSDTLGIENSVAQGQYIYTTIWQGSYAWAVPATTTYTNQPGAIANFSTPPSTLAPSASATALSLNITGISTPTNPFGTTNYSVVLTDPNGVAQFTWNNITSTQILQYPLSGSTAPSAIGGTWVWSLVAECANNQTGTTTFTTSLTAIQTWFVSVPGTATLFSNQDGLMVSYVSGLTTLPPTNPNTALKLTLSTVTTQSDSKGTSAVKVTLVDPTGRIVETWANITSPQSFTYSNLAAVQGQWIWNVWTTCTNTGLSISSYTDSWTGSFTWFQPDLTAQGSSLESRTIGFTFQVGTPNGTVFTTTDDGPQIFLQDPDNLSSDSNWYLRLHRGWLSFTDSFAHTYLVGLEPYYSQNFAGVIPIITNQSQQALVVNQNAVRIPNTPVLVDPSYPIDVVVTRRAAGSVFNTWITRDNSLSSGNYVPAALSDIDAAKGTITLASYLLQSNDTVHVTYSYLEYYYVYRGFTDGFGRFIHFDLNPTGGHTWFNLWNIQNHIGSLTGAGSSAATITNYVADVATLVDHSAAWTPASEVDIVFSASSAANASLTVPLRISSTATIGATGTTGPSTIQTSFSDESISGISTTASTVLVSTPSTETNAYTGTATLAQIPAATTTTSAESALATNNGVATVTQSSDTTIVRVSNAPAALRLELDVLDTGATGGYFGHSMTLPAPMTTTIQVDSPPVDASSQVGVTLSGLGTTGGSYPFLASNATATWPTAPGATVFAELSLTAPSGRVVSMYQLTSLSDVAFTYANANETETGQYTVSISFVAMDGQLTWVDSQPALQGAYLLTGTVNANALEKQTTFSYTTAPGAITTLTTDGATVAPTSVQTQLTLTLTGITLPSDTSGVTSYNAQLVAPSGLVVNSQNNITTNSVLSYSDPAAVAGVYAWRIWATVTSLHFGNGTYTCLVNASLSWTATQTTYSYSYTAIPSATASYFTPSISQAPTTSATQLTATISALSRYVDENGAADLSYVLTDPYGVQVKTGIVTTNSTLTYSASGATSGQYTWSFGTIVVPTSAPTLGGDYAVTADITIGSFYLASTTTYSYFATDGIAAQYETSNTTLAPTASASALTLAFSQVNAPSDLNGTSWLDVVLFNPNGLVVAVFNTISSVPVSPLSYSSAGAIGGQYIWQITAKSSTLNLGTSSYPVSFAGKLGSISTLTTSSFSAINPGATIVSTTTATLAPSGSASQLSLHIAELTLPSDLFGTSSLSVSLVLNSTQTVLQSWTTTVAHTFTYSNATAVAGQYNWVIQPTVTPSNAGTSSYTVTFVGYYGWYESKASSYNPTSPTVNEVPVTLTTAPTTVGTQLSCTISALTTPSSSAGQSFWVIGLMDPTNTVVSTWEVFDPITLVYFANGAPTGTWTWYSYAATTNSWTAAATFSCTLTASLGHYQVDQIPTTFYTANPGPVSTYSTDTFTIAPIDARTPLSLTFISAEVGSDQYGQSDLLVTLFDPNGTSLNTWIVTGPTTLIYFQAGAIGGIYTWTVQGQSVSNNNGVSRYVTQWGLVLHWYEAIENDLETSELIQRALYMYLTVDGYPFHAVLGALDNPDTPLAYDTNNAMSGTRYALMPTIHAF